MLKLDVFREKLSLENVLSERRTLRLEWTEEHLFKIDEHKGQSPKENYDLDWMVLALWF